MGKLASKRPTTIRVLYLEKHSLLFGKGILQIHRKYGKLHTFITDYQRSLVNGQQRFDEVSAAEEALDQATRLKTVFDDMLAELNSNRVFVSRSYTIFSTWIMAAEPCVEKIERDIKRLMSKKFSPGQRLQLVRNLTANLSRFRSKTEKTVIRIDQAMTKQPIC